MNYEVQLWQDEDGTWVVECPAVPGCVSQGKSIDDALSNIVDAIQACLVVRRELGMPETVQVRTVRVPA